MTLAEVASATGGVLARGDPGAAIGSVSIDSRALSPSALFVAVPGQRTDGHLFVSQACAAGAAAALVQRDVEAPPGFGLIRVDDTTLALGRLARRHVGRLGARVVAVTGSVGKTGTRGLCAAALGSRLRVLQPEGNWNTELGVPLTCLRLEPEHDALVLEYAMRGPGQIAHLCRICRPDVGVVTLIGPSHLELLGTLDNVARAKGELVQALPAGGAAILNRDDPWQAGMARRTGARVVWYGFGPGAAVTARDVEPRGAAGTRFRLVAPAGEAWVDLPLVGRHQVGNALAAAAAALELGLSPDEAAAGLAAARPASGRLEVHRLGPLWLLDDAYNAAPASCLAALDALAGLAPPERRVAVLGDMLELGPAAEAGHRQVGEAAARLPVRLLVAVGPLSARTAAAAGAVAVHCPDRAAAARALAEGLREGDVVLVKGSRAMGMEELADVVRRWAARQGGVAAAAAPEPAAAGPDPAAAGPGAAAGAPGGAAGAPRAGRP
jgi:UDP-N-acetylmuramoyl-tripeptide--D-alanyl-D-alanine ligase